MNCTPTPFSGLAQAGTPPAEQRRGAGLRVKAEAFEYRLYDLEMAYLLAYPGTPESEQARAAVERVTATYHRTYPDRPLNPRRNPAYPPIVCPPPAPPAKKQRKPYTKRARPA